MKGEGAVNQLVEALALLSGEEGDAANTKSAVEPGNENSEKEL